MGMYGVLFLKNSFLKYSTCSFLRYNPQLIEKSWQKLWLQQSVQDTSTREEKTYILSMFPYPSGYLHMGHVRVYTISDTLAQYHRMKGHKVLHPMGWDSFGLPAENAAIERNTSPSIWTEKNIGHMKRQLLSLGVRFDWNKELSTCQPDYYKWTQWIFLQLYKYGLAYRKKSLVNWDPVDCTVLANEQVDSDGCSWRSGAKVEQRYLEQWFLKITSYAESLLEGLENVDWPNHVKEIQRNWIGRSEGVVIDFKIKDETVSVFTTSPETIYGVTYLALSPSHPQLNKIMSSSITSQIEHLRNFPDNMQGINLNVNAVHPFTGQALPVYVANYVVSDYGTQAVMGVPAHDDRDAKFAEKMGVASTTVINNGVLVNSAEYSGLSVEEGRHVIADYIKSHNVGGPLIQYKLKDWLISRQRYWGAPLPLVYCDKCGVIALPESQLPVLLPSSVELSGRGMSPLLHNEEWLHTACHQCGGVARRETDTMDTFVDSSWYYLRYIEPDNPTSLVSVDLVDQWMPVDVYIGGIEHANLHLLYARFISHFLHDIGIISTREPFKKLLTQGMVQGRTYQDKRSGRYLTPVEIKNHSQAEITEKWEKMSKSKFNGIDPEDVIKEYGADTVRLFILFKAPPETAIQWDLEAIKGVYKWLNRVWRLVQDHIENVSSSWQPRNDMAGIKQLLAGSNRAIKEVTLSLEERYTFNVAIAELMTLSNVLKECSSLQGSSEYHKTICVLLQLLAPFAPHISSELWENLNKVNVAFDEHYQTDVLDQPWPVAKEDSNELVKLVIQVNGKYKGTISIKRSMASSKDAIREEALNMASEWLKGKPVDKVYVAHSGQLVNLITN